MSEHRAILRIAVPSILSNITVPLLGWVDTAIAGHLGSADFLAAIAIASALFSVTYSLFNFLRMGTGGLTAQAFGAGRRDETALLLLRGLAIAGTIGTLLLVFQTPLLHVGLSFMTATPAVVAHAANYFRVLIWGAPAMLSLYVLNGWLLGMQDARTPLFSPSCKTCSTSRRACFLSTFADSDWPEWPAAPSFRSGWDSPWHSVSPSVCSMAKR